MEQGQDIDYISRVLDGDRNAYAYLVDKYKAMVFTLALQITGNRDEAEEVAQDAFIKAFRSLGSYRGKAKFSSWLYRIVYNASISQVRRNKQRMVSIEEASIPEELSVEGALNHQSLSLEERKKYLGLALDLLDPEERMLVILYYYEERDLDDIAEIAGITKSNTKVRLFRARKKMLGVLERYLKEEKLSLL